MRQKSDIEVTRVWINLPKKLHDKLITHNETANRPINMTNVLTNGILEELNNSEMEKILKREKVEKTIQKMLEAEPEIESQYVDFEEYNKELLDELVAENDF
jgi:hypothetical protein